jgi:bacterioferritin (cytochrome b1)
MQSTKIVTNTQYNVAKQLMKELEFLWNVDGYIRDAENEGNADCAKLFRQIKADEENHAKELKKMLSSFEKG